MSLSLLDTVRDFVRRHELIPEDGPVVAAVSGGVDSMVLLDVLAQMDADPVVAHVNYGLRPGADGDEALVRSRCRELGLACHVAHLDADRTAREAGASIQAAARDLRYDYFAHLAREQNARTVATGHHRDDQAETVLLQLFRGAGPAALAGMHPSRTLDADAPPHVASSTASEEGGEDTIRLVRPLLSVSRQAIEAYAEERELTWRDDPTNTAGNSARSILRTEILPQIETLFQGASERIAHTAALMRELDAATLAPRRRSLFAAAFEARDPGGWLDADPLRDAAPVWRRRVVLDALEAALPTAPRTDAVARQVAALLDAQVGRRVPLGAGTVWRERGGLRLVPERAGTVPPTPLPFGETVDTAHGAICVERIDAPPADLSAGAPGTVYADADRLGRDLVVRSWTDGDRIQPLGMDGTKSVADLLTDAQVPPHRREHALVVAQPEHAKSGHATSGHATSGHAAPGPVAWVAGVRLDHRVRVREETRHYAKLTLR